MSGPTRYHTRDANHVAVSGWYEELFCSVLDLSSVGFGCPDLAVAAAGRMELVEVKAQDGRVKPSQKTFASTWRGPRIVIARTQADVIAHVTDLRSRVARS